MRALRPIFHGADYFMVGIRPPRTLVAPGYCIPRRWVPSDSSQFVLYPPAGEPITNFYGISGHSLLPLLRLTEAGITAMLMCPRLRRFHLDAASRLDAPFVRDTHNLQLGYNPSRLDASTPKCEHAFASPHFVQHFTPEASIAPTGNRWLDRDVLLGR